MEQSDEIQIEDELNKLKKRVGALIRFYRKDRKKSQKALAEDINVDDRFLRYIEDGERGLSFESILKIANSLGIDISQLFIENPLGATLNRPSVRILLQIIVDYSDEEIDWLSNMAIEARKLRDLSSPPKPEADQ